MDLHLPNATRPFSPAEIDLAVHVRPTALVHLVYADGVVPEHVGQVGSLVERTGARLILRPYEREIMRRWQAWDWGRECGRRTRPYLRFGRPAVVVTNEDNLPEEGGITEPWALWRYWVEAAAGVRSDLGDAVDLALPPLAPVGNYREIYGWIVSWGVPRHFQRVACHAYARTGNWSDPAWLRAQTGLPVDVTEWDSWLGEGRYLPLSECLAKLEGAEARCWFILSSDDPAFDFCNLLKHRELLEVEMELQAIVEGLRKHLEESGEMARLALDQNALLTELVVRILEGKFDAASHGDQSAEALLYAVSPNMMDRRLQVVRFPKG
ncbi:MAG: hypothetical protein AB1609_22195 [Bacillota bacterium]